MAASWKLSLQQVNLMICTSRFGLDMNVGLALDGTPRKTRNPKVVCNLKWFLAYKYIFKSKAFINL